MGYIRTVITAAVGDKCAGKAAPNRPDDVRKIQQLLKRALGPAAPIFQDGVCNASTTATIAEFQNIWGGMVDGRVDPTGHTLQRLDRLANPLVLEQISLLKVTHGGYRIPFRTVDGGQLPPAGRGYTLLLGFPAEANSVDVTGRPAAGLLRADNLGKVLAIFDKLGCWAVPVQCQLHLKYKSALISSSNAMALNAPVQPHNGRMLPLDEENNGPKLTYQGDVSAGDFHGRMFASVDGYQKNMFVWAGQFETQNEFRGFDCITYVGTTCGGSNLHMHDSDDTAESIGARPVDHTHTTKDPRTGKASSAVVKLEEASPAYVKEFFATNSSGYYVMFSGGHIVLVADGKVYEFKASGPSGYSCSDVGKWLEPYKTMKLTVRKLPGKPARAV